MWLYKENSEKNEKNTCFIEHAMNKTNEIIRCHDNSISNIYGKKQIIIICADTLRHPVHFAIIFYCLLYYKICTHSMIKKTNALLARNGYYLHYIRVIYMNKCVLQKLAASLNKIFFCY